MIITLDVLEPDATTLVAAVEMANVVDGSVEDMVAGDSLGELAVGLESPNRPDLLVRGRVLRWNGTGGKPFHSIVEANDQVSIAETGSKVPRQITVRGRGLVAQWEAARVGQWPDMAHVPYYTRHFNYASPGKCEEIDGTAYDHGAVLDIDSNGQPNQPDRPPPTSWRAPTARRIGSAAFNLDEPDGISLFRTSLTTGEEARFLRQHGTADDRILGWVGGVPVLKGPDAPQVTWLETWPSATAVNPDTTYDIVYATSNEFTALGGSATWLGADGWLLDNQGAGLTADTLAYVTQTSGWYALRPLLDPTPGWTPPEILEVLRTEAAAKNQLTGWQVIDMAPTVGVEWTAIQERTYETRKTTGLDVIRGFETDGLAEFDTEVVSGVKRLLVFPPDTMGNYYTAAPGVSIPAGRLVSASYRWAA